MTADQIADALRKNLIEPPPAPEMPPGGCGIIDPAHPTGYAERTTPGGLVVLEAPPEDLSAYVPTFAAAFTEALTQAYHQPRRVSRDSMN